MEFYFPSLGGAQEVVRRIAEQLAARGHSVTVATSRIAGRNFLTHRGVRIKEFAITGNLVRGMRGEVERYHEYLVNEYFEVVFFYAAQQWTFDAAWAVMDKILGKKVLVPCGYSGLYDPAYSRYFASLPKILGRFDHLIYHAASYRDVEYGRAHSLVHSSLIPNGAECTEFFIARDLEFRLRHNISDDAVVLLTVGTMTGAKGHAESLDAFERATFPGRSAVLILNGNEPRANAPSFAALRLLYGILRTYDWRHTWKQAVKKILWKCGVRVGKARTIRELAVRLGKRPGRNKRVIVCDLPREELIQAFLNADLFVFASNVEYSPLVLFEASAAGLPFLSVPVGNAAEIAAWTGAGAICPASIDARGYTRVSPDELARNMEALIANPEKRVEMGRCGRRAFQERYNWDAISKEYEALFMRLVGTAAKTE